MCIAAPGIVKSIKGREAVVDYMSVTQRAMIGVDSLKVGDRVLVQMGIVIKVINEKSRKKLSDSWRKKPNSQ